MPRYEAVVKLPGMPLNKRFILQVPKLSEPTNHQPTKQDSAYLDPIARLEQIYKLECDLGTKKPSDSPTDTTDQTEPDTLPDKASGFDWTIQRFGQMCPNVTPKQLFAAVSDAALSGANIRTIIKSVLKCGEGNEHPSRSYTRHGKSLLKWLIENYDNGEISQLPKIQEFLQSEKE